MKIVFMGTPEFAVASLDILVKNKYTIAAVITAPDKPAGRGQQLQQSAVKKYALENNLPLLQPLRLKDETFLQSLRELGADLQVVVAFRMLPEVLWQMPAHGTFNLHASLLPQYRGAAPINWAVINGEKETGISTFFLQHEIDTGKIILRDKTGIGENETAGELHDRLMYMGANLVLKTVQAIENGSYTETDQMLYLDKNKPLRQAPKIFKEDCRINWSKDIHAVHNLIRGLSPYPAAWTELHSPAGEVFQLKIFSTRKEICKHTAATGKIFSDGGKCLKITVTDGYIHINDLQLAGKKRMLTNEFLRGFKLDEAWQVQ